MKIYAKLLWVVFLTTMTSASFAQTFGIKAGLNLSNMIAKDNDNTYSDDYKIKLGFHLGVTAEFPLTDFFSFETGLLLSTKGFKSSEEYDGGASEYKETVTLNYLDIPLTAKASFNVGGAKIYGVVGPYLGMGISGKDKTEDISDGETFPNTQDIKWGSDKEKDMLRRLDYGVTAGAGVEINSIQIGLTYGLGLANIVTNTDNGAKLNNRVIGISVGYKFGRK